MSARLFAQNLRNDGEWVGTPTLVPELAAQAGQWLHLTGTDPACAGRAVALLAGSLRATGGTLRFEMAGHCWEPTNGSAHLWAWLRRQVVHHAGGYLPIAPSEPVRDAVTRLAGVPDADDVLGRHGLDRLAGRRWGELADRPRHQVSLVVALAAPTPILLLDLVGVSTASLLEHAALRVADGALLITAGDHTDPHPNARTVHLPDEGNR